MSLDKIRKFFLGSAHNEAARLTAAHDSEIGDIAALIDGAGSHGIPRLERMPDDPGTGVSTALAARTLDQDPMMLARMAEVWDFRT